MDVMYRDTVSAVRWEEVASLFEQVGWGARSENEIEAAFRRSGHVRFAQVRDQLVGFGRTIDDGHYYGMIVDLIVAPAYQGHGIGKSILGQLASELRACQFVTLTSDAGKEEFYRKQGWKPQKTAFMLPRSERQMRRYCTGD